VEVTIRAREIDDTGEESKMKQNISLALEIEGTVSHLSCHSVRHRREGHGHSDKCKEKKD
jgi:hypothetical protein